MILLILTPVTQFHWRAKGTRYPHRTRSGVCMCHKNVITASLSHPKLHMTQKTLCKLYNSSKIKSARHGDIDFLL